MMSYSPLIELKGNAFVAFNISKLYMRSVVKNSDATL